MMKILAENKKAYFNFEILEKFEAGISLLGQEVKSLLEGRVNLSGSYIIVRGNEVFWVGIKIPAWQPKNAPGYKEQRDRKLLLKKNEIRYLRGKVKQKGLTLIPLRLYVKNKRIKLEFGLVKGKKKYMKKEKMKEREIKREIMRVLKRY